MSILGEVWAQTRRLELKRRVLPRNAFPGNRPKTLRFRATSVWEGVGFRESILSILGGGVLLTEGSGLKRGVLSLGRSGFQRESTLSILGGGVPLTEGSGLKRGVLS